MAWLASFSAAILAASGAFAVERRTKNIYHMHVRTAGKKIRSHAIPVSCPIASPVGQKRALPALCETLSPEGWGPRKAQRLFGAKVGMGED